MAVHILVCECGERVKAPGAKAGRVGRCPKCGRRLQVPGPPAAFRLKPDDDEPLTGKREGIRQRGTSGNQIEGQPFRLKPDNSEPLAAKPGGSVEHARSTYQLLPVFVPAARPRKRGPASEQYRPNARAGQSVDAGPMADGLLPVPERPESNWFASFLYPLRSIESMGVIAVLSGVFWLFVILVPEYCLTVMGDAGSMGAPTLGKLIALISILPVGLLLPFAVFYWVQYLARVVVCSAMGDTMPPRTPDRNFDGFFNGLSPWCVWLALGVSVGLLPLLVYGLYAGSTDLWSWPLALVLFGVGSPYVVMALLMSLLHDNALAADPVSVICAMFRVGTSFLLVCTFTLCTIGLGPAAFTLLLWLRPGHFWIYLALCLCAWVVALWCSIVAMRVLGTYYYHRRDLLNWHHERPRWGVAWKL